MATCALCGLTGPHGHRTHLTEVHGEAEVNGSVTIARIRLSGCTACGEASDELAPDSLCPSLIEPVAGAAEFGELVELLLARMAGRADHRD